MSVSLFLFFKQKTAYDLRISDWSSDVCSSDLDRSGSARFPGASPVRPAPPRIAARRITLMTDDDTPHGLGRGLTTYGEDRKSVVQGKSVSVRVDIGGRRIIKNKNTTVLNKKA